MLFSGNCRTCQIDSYDYDDDANGCYGCGGEGFTYGCGWDWQCDTWDGDSCLCTRRCDWCQPLTPSELTERADLQQVLADALAEPTTQNTRAALDELIASTADQYGDTER
jgi:hypothetical protein